MIDSQFSDKGGRTEELLRGYFLELGYFVVRGAKYSFEGSEITDIDLWLYQRTSSFSRDRFNVDIKNKKSPQALERILWAKGVQQCLHLNGALVATTDTRQSIKKFGDQNDVVILDGTLLSKLKKRYGGSSTRLEEEELIATVRGDKNDRVGSEWLDRVTSAKSRVLTQFNFDGCNSHLNDAKTFAEQVLANSHRSGVACRLFYLSLALCFATLDFLFRDLAFIDRHLQADALNNGLRFGTLGKDGAERVFSTAAKIGSAYLRGQNVRPSELVNQLRSESMKLPVEVLTEFLLKFNQSKPLFELARSFEKLAFARTFEHPSDLTSEHRGAIGAILDFHQMERKSFFEVLPPQHVPNIPTPSQVKPQQEELHINAEKASGPDPQGESIKPS